MLESRFAPVCAHKCTYVDPYVYVCTYTYIYIYTAANNVVKLFHHVCTYQDTHSYKYSYMYMCVHVQLIQLRTVMSSNYNSIEPFVGRSCLSTEFYVPVLALLESMQLNNTFNSSWARQCSAHLVIGWKCIFNCGAELLCGLCSQ